jgi:hypothetical protein
MNEVPEPAAETLVVSIDAAGRGRGDDDVLAVLVDN